MIVIGNNCISIDWFKEYLFLFLNREVVILEQTALLSFSEHDHDKTDFILTEEEYEAIKENMTSVDTVIIINKEYDNTVCDELLYLLDLKVMASEFNRAINIDGLMENDPTRNNMKEEVIVEKYRAFFSEELKSKLTVLSRLNIDSVTFTKCIYDYLKSNTDKQYIVIDLDTNPTLNEFYRLKLDPLLNLDNLKEMWDVDPKRVGFNVLYLQGTINIKAWNDLLCMDWNEIFSIWKKKGVLESVHIIVLMNLENNFSNIFCSMVKNNKGVVFTNNKKANLRELLLKLNADALGNIVIAVESKKEIVNNVLPQIKAVNYEEVGGVLSGWI